MAAPSRIGGRALADLLPDLRAMPGPVYTALARSITSLVLDGRVATQTRLPSERDLATVLDLSRATVTAAYDTLRNEGYLTSRTGSGSYVAVPPDARLSPSLMRWTTRSVGSVANAADLIDLSCATLPAPPDVVAAAVTDATAHLAPYLLGDGYEPAGLSVLRAAVAERYTRRGATTRPEQILITNGALHGFDLLLRLLVSAGDRVITELPTYPGALDAIRGNGGRVMPVPMAPAGGWQVDQLQATMRQTAAHLAYLTPDFHNPTGALVPEAARRAVFKTARSTGTTVVVDESFVDLGFDGAERPAAALDPTVVTVGSLSKPIWGGLRIGWLRASTDLVHRLAALRTSIDMGGPVLDQIVAAQLIGRIDEIAAERVAVLRPQRDALLGALAAQLPDWQFAIPQGGLSLWAQLPAPLSTPLTMLAAHSGVVIVPGSRFGIDGTLERFLRLPYALPADRLTEAVRRIAEVWAQLVEHGAVSGLGTRQLVVA